MMILAGRVIAEFSVENSISMPYLSQEPGNFSDEVIKNINKLSPSKAFEAARGFNRSKLSVKHSLHSGLGLEAYLRVTSPMRRYLDLLVQQQLVRFITKNDLLNETDIKERIKAVNASMSKSIKPLGRVLSTSDVFISNKINNGKERASLLKLKAKRLLY